MRSFFTIALFFASLISLSQVTIPSYYRQSKSFDAQLKAIVQEVGLDLEPVVRVALRGAGRREALDDRV